METIFKRASVRKFTDEAVTDQQIEALMRAAMAAPSAGNQQPWVFYATKDKAILEALSQASKYAGPAAGAAVAFVPCVNEEGLRFPECAPQDMSAAIENLLLEAVEQGLGAVWMGIAPLQDRMDAVAAILGTEASHKPFAIIAVGHPADEVSPRCADYYDSSRVIWK